MVKSEFNFKEEKDFVAIHFGVDELGGWSDKSHVMTVEK